MRITSTQLRQIIREELIREATGDDPEKPEFDELEMRYIAAGLINADSLRGARARKAAYAAEQRARREARRARASLPPRESEADYYYDLEMAARSRARAEADAETDGDE